MSWTVVIPSKNITNLGPCLRALYAAEPQARVMVVDDGLAFRPKGPYYLQGGKPFNFSRNCNYGIVAAGTDVILFNDDALLKTPQGFTQLSVLAQTHPEYGLISSSCNYVGNLNQWPKGAGLRDEPRMVCFVAVYIPRTTIDSVGLLDERYIGYGLEDDDYCLRVRNAGLKIGVWDGTFVDHGSLKSTFRGAPMSPGDVRMNMSLFRKKWGTDNWGQSCAEGR
jgi:glycosyltransferase involved in cell wall biosynthesis